MMPHAPDELASHCLGYPPPFLLECISELWCPVACEAISKHVSQGCPKFFQLETCLAGCGRVMIQWHYVILDNTVSVSAGQAELEQRWFLWSWECSSYFKTYSRAVSVLGLGLEVDWNGLNSWWMVEELRQDDLFMIFKTWEAGNKVKILRSLW